MKIILMFMFMLSMVLMTLKHPLSMGVILILQTIISSLIMGYLLKSFFFTYIIIIIMLSGALVLFIYMASVASNEKFYLSNIEIMSLLMIFMFLVMSYKLISLQSFNVLMMNEQISLMKIFNMNSAKITLMVIIYLLFTMIVVSNNVKINEGPLRMKTKYE
uniref:NADH dehydrogenase subunit 6 n=1 Tax=Scotinophara lurida TaxID=1331320 RepID=A0A4D6X213_9HEMI|nr:NADH dehydrogenase subunit 6 [Scotinophara lurida]QCI09452.1 NADH dehydrogenase subunit 6 [Scotinophara lurida]